MPQSQSYEVAEPVRLRSWATMGEALLAGSVDLVHLLRVNYDGLPMASLAKRAFTDEATKEAA